MQCEDSHNRKAVPCHTSKFSPFGTLQNHCASEGPCTPRPPGARPPHACSRGSRPRLTPCPPRLQLTQRDPTSHAAWCLSLPHCSSRPPAVPCRCRTWNAMSPADPSHSGHRHLAWRGTVTESHAAVGAGGEGVCSVHISFMASPPPWAAPTQPQARFNVVVRHL